MSNYTLDFTWVIWFALVSLVLGFLFARFLIPKGRRRKKTRIIGFLVCLALIALSMPLLYLNPKVYNTAYNKIAVENRYINQMSDVEVFTSRGCVFPFLYSFRDLIPTPPEGYNASEAASLLHKYPDADIPEDKKVSVMGIMLEAFSDFSDFPLLGQQESVQQIYAPWHEFEQESVSGDLLTNIFAGGTVDSEWAFLTGYSRHDEFRKITDSYVWYLKEQGYQTFGVHPGNDWFYNRVNVNQYLGFDDYWFLENHYSDQLTLVSAIAKSDYLIARDLMTELGKQVAQGPTLSFSVSIQNHGPYSDAPTAGTAFLTPEATGMTEQSCNIWNNYLNGIQDTIGVMLNLRDELEQMAEPVVLVLFGDHKPWGGNGNSAYTDMGATFDMSTTGGFYDYYSTPYVIWANSAAKEVLGNDFQGDGGDFSPCFLMTKLFDLCGWEGPGFMQLSRDIREITPLLHVLDVYLQDGEVTPSLSESDRKAVSDFLGAQYYRETEVQPAAAG